MYHCHKSLLRKYIQREPTKVSKLTFYSYIKTKDATLVSNLSNVTRKNAPPTNNLALFSLIHRKTKIANAWGAEPKTFSPRKSLPTNMLCVPAHTRDTQTLRNQLTKGIGVGTHRDGWRNRGWESIQGQRPLVQCVDIWSNNTFWKLHRKYIKTKVITFSRVFTKM